jgi:1,4-dihydroxy-2-naphthoyl-CoA hydrolase
MALIQVDEINKFCKNTLIEHLGIVFTEITEDTVKATMPVDHRTKQPMGLLHGGAAMALVETVGSVGSYVLVDHTQFDVVGMEINGNHVGNTFEKMAYAVGKLLHKGKRTHVWGVNIYDEKDRPISICRITNMIVEKNGK